MSWSRRALLLCSGLLVCFIVGGGLVVQVGASDNTAKQAVLFAEILDLVLDNYVDPTDATELLDGAYEAMVNGIDPNGAYLTPDEVAEWKRMAKADGQAGPGLTVLKIGRTLQIVGVSEGSSAAEAGIEVGNQVRMIDGKDVQELSLDQARSLLSGRSKSRVEVEVVRPLDDFARDTHELIRVKEPGPAFESRVEGEIGVVSLHHLDFPASMLGERLSQLRQRGIEHLLLDLRNLADGDARLALPVAALFLDDGALTLRSRAGEVLEQVKADGKRVWSGELSLLTNGATAEAGEALAVLLTDGDNVSIYGEVTFGLGAEPELFPLDNGGALVVSTQRWESAGGTAWHGEGLEPDERVRGRGETYAEVSSDQLQKVLDLLSGVVPEEEKAAA